GVGFLVLIFSVIYDFHNRRFGIGNNFNKIQLFFFGHLKSLNRGNNTNHLASVVDQPNRGYSDVFIDPNARPAKFLRTAVKKSSSYGFLFKNYCGDDGN
ncbi:MAG TPA: hypothetical protein VMQ48_02930, partial [Candidatus Saccharimonadales bacterium]|nr:hypothetical protein [Candidatus Saccharimonadales bacterium]